MRVEFKKEGIVYTNFKVTYFCIGRELRTSKFCQNMTGLSKSLNPVNFKVTYFCMGRELRTSKFCQNMTGLSISLNPVKLI